MSTTTEAPASPCIPWTYLSGYLVFFVGLGVSFFGGILFSGGPKGIPPKDVLPPLALAGFGFAVVACGSYLMARAEQIRGCHLGGLAVCFLMTPLPSLVGLLINFAGNWMRKTSSTTLQVILLGGGVFLVALAGNWATGIQQGMIARVDFRVFTWIFVADFGVIALVLAALPMFVPEEIAADPTSNEPETIPV